MNTPPLPGKFELAPGKTNHEWIARSPGLKARADAKTSDPAEWKKILREFYRARLSSRYISPIKAIRRLRRNKGEGFSVVALQCSLIEFLEGTFQGINYKRKNAVPPYEYSKSKEIFAKFLTSHKPFDAKFSKPEIAIDFYEHVRCGILHEARTYEAWRVWNSSRSGSIIDFARKIVYRDDFQEALEEFIADYCSKVPYDPELQLAFIRKYDALSKDT
jgi:hypothetical protein